MRRIGYTDYDSESIEIDEHPMQEYNTMNPNYWIDIDITIFKINIRFTISKTY